MSKITYILSTKQVSDEMIQAAAADDIAIEVDTFIKMRSLMSVPKVKELAKQDLTVVFTSVQGAATVCLPRRFREVEPRWKVFCIGQATATFIREFCPECMIAGTANNSAELANVILQHPEVKEITYICGSQRRPELPEILTAHNVKVNELAVYYTMMLPHYVKRKYDGILFFSPSSVEAFFALNKVDDDTVFFAIGNTTGNAVKTFTNNKIITVDVPSLEGLIQQAVDYFKSIRVKR